jgi:hypothetical protein
MPASEQVDEPARGQRIATVARHLVEDFVLGGNELFEQLDDPIGVPLGCHDLSFWYAVSLFSAMGQDALIA